MEQMKKILIVDDDEDFQDIYRLYLRAESYQLKTASNGQEGLQVLQEGFQPDLILLDLIMPVMDGEAFYKALRSKPEWAAIPVIVASVNERLPAGIQKRGGVKGILKKPFGVEQLLDLTRSILQ